MDPKALRVYVGEQVMLQLREPVAAVCYHSQQRRLQVVAGGSADNPQIAYLPALYGELRERDEIFVMPMQDGNGPEIEVTIDPALVSFVFRLRREPGSVILPS